MMQLDFSSFSTVEYNWNLGNLGQQDTNPTASNVYSFAASALAYTNVTISSPSNNAVITGLMIRKSYNETH
jgi:hypothetical protein